MEAGPEHIAAMLGELMGLFAAGALVPLPVKTFDVRRAAALTGLSARPAISARWCSACPTGPVGWQGARR